MSTVEASPSPGGYVLPSRAGIDWKRFARRAFIAGMVVFGVAQLVLMAMGTQYGFDFRGGTWQAGHALLDGRSPFPPPYPAALLHIANGFITPPLLGVVAIPFSLLGFHVALILWNLVCTLAFAVALRLLGVRDWRIYVVAVCCFPFVSSLALGQPDGLFALAAAIAWRHRGSSRGAVAVGVLIAAKLFAWPLVIWLVVTRRYKLAATAAASAAGLLALSWAAIGFKGLLSYPRLLSAETHAYGPKSHSYVAAFTRLGASLSVAEVASVLAAGLTAFLVLRAARSRDFGWFTAALTFGLLVSPVVWQHYLVVLFVPLAVSRRLRDPLVWVVIGALWLSPVESPPTLWQTWLVPVLASVLAVRAAGGAGALAQNRFARGASKAIRSIAVSRA